MAAGRMVIGAPAVSETVRDGEEYVRSTVEIAEFFRGREARHEVWFEVGKEYADGLCTTLCDAYVVGLLRYCMQKGLDVASELPMSASLHYNLSTEIIPVLAKGDPAARRIALDVPLVPDSEVRAGKAVGTGASCGADSLYSIIAHKGYPDPGHRLTHLCINDVGAFNIVYNFRGRDRVRDAVYARASSLAQELGLPLVRTFSNFMEAIPQDHRLSHTFSSCFATLMMRHLWGTYYYSSSGESLSGFGVDGFLSRGPDEYEIMLLPAFSGPNLRIYSDGAGVLRTEKLELVADSEVERKYLHSCLEAEYNCGKCSKCLRNLLTLDALGKLDLFDGVYDVGMYRGSRERSMMIMAEGAKRDRFYSDILDLFKERKPADYEKITAVRDVVDEALEEYGRGVDVRKNVEIISNYVGYSDKCLMVTVHEMMANGGFERNYERIVSMLKGMCSRSWTYPVVLLIDVYLRGGESRKAFKLARSYSDVKDRRIALRIARMYRDGTGTRQSRRKAMLWMKKCAGLKGVDLRNEERLIEERCPAGSGGAAGEGERGGRHRGRAGMPHTSHGCRQISY